MGKRVPIAGGAGFQDSNMSERLVRDGHQCLDSFLIGRRVPRLPLSSIEGIRHDRFMGQKRSMAFNDLPHRKTSRVGEGL